MEYYEDLLKFVVNRIWITEEGDYSDTKKKIEDRFKKFPSLKILYLFARSSLRIEVIELACKHFVNENKGLFKFESKARQLLGKIAKDFKIIKI